jgi:hypothetical protein
VRALFIASLVLAVAACGPAPGEFGASCTAASECSNSTDPVCLDQFAGGYCSQRCEELGCPEGTRCAALATGSFCLQNCSLTLLDCRSDYACADVGGGGICLPDCTEDAQCGPGARCEEKECVPATPGATGAPCLVNAGCSTERCEPSYNGGVCTAPCAQEGPGSFNTGCDPPGVCAEVSEAGGLCLGPCTSDANCRDEYYCDRAGTAGVCRPKCRGSASCALGYTCDVAGSRRCVEGKALPRKTGAPCANDGECDSAYCLDPTLSFPKGICSDVCTDSAARCGSDGLCIVPADPTLDSICLQKCRSNFDCRADYFCSAVRNSEERICLPRCTAVPLCNAPEICDTYSGDCVPPGAQGTTSVSRVAIGQFPISGTQAQKAFTLEVPADAISFTLAMRGGVGGTSTVSQLRSPSGEVLFDLDEYLTSKVRILPVNDGDFGMLFPNSPRVAIEPGRYAFTVVNEQGSGTGEVFALVKRATTTRLGAGKISLNFWFAGLSGLTAATAPTHTAMQAAISELRAIYATAGIALGDLAYFDVPAAQSGTLAVIDTTDGKDSELRRLFELSAGAPNTALNFFLVREIKGAGAGFVILGVAGGIPGIPFEQGTNASGVAVTALDLSQDPKSVGRTMAHEGGHWLGLWHTTEQNGKMFDPLSDTPECSSSLDQNADKILSSEECASAGSEFLMFWQAGPTASKLSGNQGFVLLRNPVITTQ